MTKDILNLKKITFFFAIMILIGCNKKTPIEIINNGAYMPSHPVYKDFSDLNYLDTKKLNSMFEILKEKTDKWNISSWKKGIKKTGEISGNPYAVWDFYVDISIPNDKEYRLVYSAGSALKISDIEYKTYVLEKNSNRLDTCEESTLFDKMYNADTKEVSDISHYSNKVLSYDTTFTVDKLLNRYKELASKKKITEFRIVESFNDLYIKGIWDEREFVHTLWKKHDSNKYTGGFCDIKSNVGRYNDLIVWQIMSSDDHP